MLLQHFDYMGTQSSYSLTVQASDGTNTGRCYSDNKTCIQVTFANIDTFLNKIYMSLFYMSTLLQKTQLSSNKNYKVKRKSND